MSAAAEIPPASFRDLEQIHADLEDQFRGHQVALVLNDLSKAQALLADFDAGLRRHIQIEEQWLLPLYEARRDRSVQGNGVATELYSLEHRRILDLLARLQKTLEHFPRNHIFAPLQIIAILDFERTLKNLLEHHNLREHRILYPALDGLTSPEERAQLMH